MAPTLRSLLNRWGSFKFLVPAAAISGALTIGAPSAHALQTGSLAFSNGNGDFFSQIDLTDPADTFSVVFNPTPSVVTSSTVTGIFSPPFTITPPTNVDFGVTQSTGVFNYFAAGPDPGTAIYKLAADTAIPFSNGVSVGIFGGVDFLVSVAGNSAEVLVLQTLPPELTAFVTGLPGAPVTVTAGAFTFNDTQPAGGGTYSAQIDIARVVDQVPGPLPILGAGAAFGFSRRLRKRVKASLTA